MVGPQSLHGPLRDCPRELWFSCVVLIFGQTDLCLRTRSSSMVSMCRRILAGSDLNSPVCYLNDGSPSSQRQRTGLIPYFLVPVRMFSVVLSVSYPSRHGFSSDSSQMLLVSLLFCSSVAQLSPPAVALGCVACVTKSRLPSSRLSSSRLLVVLNSPSVSPAFVSIVSTMVRPNLDLSPR